ncbi:MAG: DUF2911 domain-containing protein [Bacteroidota bacterium]|nr:DUF2911 domain-containing protein [Bacteroidota bacterium]
MRKTLLQTIAFTALWIGSAQAQTIPFPQPSPTTSISQNFATSKIEISYSRPGVKGRKIFGDVVPFDKFWRTGANSATTLNFGEDVKINGTDVKAGKYGLISFPGSAEWILVLSKDLNVTDGDAYKKENDIARFTVKSEKLSDLVETFTIEINNIRNNSCDLILKWENTAVRLNITTNYDERISKQISEVMAKDTRPYYGAASYYFDNNKDLNQALTWVNKAIEANPKAFWAWHLKAKIQKGLKDYNGAIESATKSTELAMADHDDAYVKNNAKLMDEIKAIPGFKMAAPKKK